MTATRADRSTRVPAALPQVRVDIDGDGVLSVTVDREPYDVPTDLAEQGRVAVPKLLEQIATRLASPVRVEVVDGGATFTDIVVPAGERSCTAAPAAVPVSAGEIAGSGFTPDEPVAVAVVVAHQAADANGVARLRLPPALLSGRAGQVVLLGQTSGTIAHAGSTT